MSFDFEEPAGDRIILQVIFLKKRFNAMVLHKLIRKMCNGSTVLVEEDVVGIMIEGFHNFMMVTWEDYATLPSYLKASEHEYQVLRETGFELTSYAVRHLHLNELMSRRETESGTCKALEGWKNEANDDKDKTMKDLGKELITDAIRSGVYIKRSGSNFEQFTRDLSNGNESRSRHHPSNVCKTNR